MQYAGFKAHSVKHKPLVLHLLGMWDTLHTAFDRSRGTLGTVADATDYYRWALCVQWHPFA